jgi:hypothetical protein
LDIDDQGKSDDALLHIQDYDWLRRWQAVHLMAGLKHLVTPDRRYFVVRESQSNPVRGRAMMHGERQM